jgi:hypothetical protein
VFDDTRAGGLCPVAAISALAVLDRLDHPEIRRSADQKL